MNYRNYILFLLSFLSLITLAQKKNPEVDSLLAKTTRLLEEHPDSALNLAFKAAELSQKNFDTLRLIRSYQKIGEAYNKMDDADLNITYAQKAAEAAGTISDEILKTRLTYELGRALFRKGYFDQGMIQLKKAKNAVDKLSDEGLKFLIYNDLGFSFIVSYANLDSAEHYYTIAIKIAEKQKDSTKIAHSYISIAHVYSTKKKWDEQLVYLHKALDIFTRKKHLTGILQANKSIGDVYYYKKETAKAIEYYKIQYSLSHELKSTTNIAFAACDLAYMYAVDKNITLLNKYAEESKKAALLTKSWPAMKYVGGWLSEAYEMTGNAKTALEYFKIYNEAKDSINDHNRIEKSSRAEAQLNFESKVEQLKREEEKRKAITEEKGRYQRVIRNILIIGFIIATALLFFTYRNFIQKKKANMVISRQKEEVQAQKQKIEAINKELTDSINYARIIQRSILPDEQDILKVFPLSFGLYLPKSVVSGDFYWFASKNSHGMMASVDCTGHGVPGALMSMIGIEKLNEAIASNLVDPSDILSHLNKGVKVTLRQKESSSMSRDGMDIALCCFDLSKNVLKYAGANRPLWLIRRGNLIEYKPTKSSIGGYTEVDQKFTTHEIQLEKGDSIYICTDGFGDQFGGDKGKKLMSKNLKTLLLAIQHIPLLQQEKVLEEKFRGWQRDYEQVDDVLIIGIQV